MTWTLRLKPGALLVLAPGHVEAPAAFERDLGELAQRLPAVRFVLVEGNYLLMDESPWYGLANLFDHTVYLDVPRAELERRLVQRWLDHGLAPDAARARAAGNDLPNAERVMRQRREPDTVLKA